MEKAKAVNRFFNHR